jgi:hypothetical protein
VIAMMSIYHEQQTGKFTREKVMAWLIVDGNV